MKLSGDGLMTPVYLKTSPQMPWPDEAVFYMLTADGLFLCRNHAFFRSTVPAPHWPSELVWHSPSLQVRYPKIPRQHVQQIVAFFAYVGEHHSAEAIVLLGWNQASQQVEIIVPQQVATVGRNRWGECWPVGVDYERPANLIQDVTIFGDVHSHVDGRAYASGIDRSDETHRPGLHIVIGRIFLEPPEFFVQAVVDGTRFELKLDSVLEGYARRAARFPDHWLERVWIKWPGAEPHAARPTSEPQGDWAEGNGRATSLEGSKKQKLLLPPSQDGAMIVHPDSDLAPPTDVAGPTKPPALKQPTGGARTPTRKPDLEEDYGDQTQTRA